VVRAEAIRIYSHYTESGDEEKGSFHVNKGWFENSMKQMSPHNKKRIGSASADHVTGAKY
jgi:hypothetical protein